MNIMDEQGRMVRLPEYRIKNQPEQTNSHTCSYLYARQQYQKMGLVMGLDNLERPQELRDSISQLIRIVRYTSDSLEKIKFRRRLRELSNEYREITGKPFQIE